MKSLLHWSVIASLLGSSLVGPSLLKITRAMALPESEVIKRLQSVPVFTVTNEKGSPILISDPKQKTGPQVATFFVSQKEAQGLLNQIKTRNATLGKTAKVVPTSLGKAFELARQNRDKKDIAFQFVPNQQQVSSAEALLRQRDPKFKQFNDVPLFYAVDTKSKGLLSIASKQDNSKIIPLYFSQQDLQGVVDQLKKQKPQLGATTQIQVTSLSRVIASMLQENGPEINQLTLVPSPEARAFISSLQQSQAGAQRPAPVAPQRR